MSPKTDERPLDPGDFARALQLLTRLPVPAGPQSDRPVGMSAWSWPLVGALIGLAAGLIAALVLWLGATAGLAAGLAMTVQIVATGALHEDGLADAADGLWGGHDRETRLEIMKDSRTGAYGVVALVLGLILRWSALAALFGTGWIIAPLIAAGALSRAPMAVLMAALPNARNAGLSHDTGRPQPDSAALSVAMALVVAFVVLGWASLAPAFWVALTTIATARLAQVKLGGQTGDILGAGQQFAEIAALSALAALAV